VLITALLVIILLSDCYSQNASIANNPLQNDFIFGLDAGVTYPQTDYQIVKLGFSGRGVGEYFFNTNSIHLPGLKLKVGYDQLTGEDTRGTISSPDAENGTRDIPASFSTNIFSVGVAATYCISINDVVFPYVSGGISNLWFDPKDAQGNPAEYNAAGKYKKSTIAYTLEIGLKVLLSDKISLNFSANPYFPKTDYLDDVAAAYINDSYTTLMVGISFSPFYSSDSDGDGVADAIDKCPDTPIGVKVDEFGCPVDTDKDGVPDYLDKCPDTPVGIMVDQKGCPVNETNLNKFLLAADDIFAPNSSMIKVEGKKYLDEVVTQLQKFPNKKWRIEGYMDSNGGVRYLRNLSLDRAKAVLEYFTNFGGLKRENFQVFGMGDNFPIGDNNTEEGRIKNRRIEINPEE
jgi:outer membrane protein OmpA-like peptidoglycan-associated protein